ncbi:MAG: DNA-binding protein [Ignavibacteriae bacterium]|nr:MAG: DNA-binding protein [Ignavibacteriota bacterium]
MKNWSIPKEVLDKPFLSPKELQTILGLSLPTIYRLVNERKLPAFKVGNSLRFQREDIISYLESTRIDQMN